MRNKRYRLFIGGVHAATGDIDLIARVLGIAPDTAQHYSYKGRAPEGITINACEKRYDVGGELMTADRAARKLGASKTSVYAAAARGVNLKGRRVCRVFEEDFELPDEAVRELMRGIGKGWD